jgi:hypothetical protein
MASIDKRPNGKWRARYRVRAGGPQRSKHFDRKTDAERFLTRVQGLPRCRCHQTLSGRLRPWGRNRSKRLPRPPKDGLELIEHPSTEIGSHHRPNPTPAPVAHALRD